MSLVDKETNGQRQKDEAEQDSHGNIKGKIRQYQEKKKSVLIWILK